jgi:hypothetical protein
MINKIFSYGYPNDLYTFMTAMIAKYWSMVIKNLIC